MRTWGPWAQAGRPFRPITSGPAGRYPGGMKAARTLTLGCALAALGAGGAQARTMAGASSSLPGLAGTPGAAAIGLGNPLGLPFLNSAMAPLVPSSMMESQIFSDSLRAILANQDAVLDWVRNGSRQAAQAAAAAVGAAAAALLERLGPQEGPALAPPDRVLRPPVSRLEAASAAPASAERVSAASEEPAGSRGPVDPGRVQAMSRRMGRIPALAGEGGADVFFDQSRPVRLP